jgi:hypothetical protein
LRRSDADLEQALFKPIAAFANRLSENWIGRLGNMPEKLRFEGTPVVLLLVLGESFRAAMAKEQWFSKTNLDCFDLYHRRALRRVYDLGGAGSCARVSFGGVLMSIVEQRIAPIANLIAQLRELNQLRERVRKAELAARSRRIRRRKRTLIRRLAPSLHRSGNHRSVSPT